MNVQYRYVGGRTLFRDKPISHEGLVEVTEQHLFKLYPYRFSPKIFLKKSFIYKKLKKENRENVICYIHDYRNTKRKGGIKGVERVFVIQIHVRLFGMKRIKIKYIK